MIRKYVVAKDQEDVGSRLLKAGIPASQTVSATNALRRVNANVDLAKLSAGAVLLVPDVAGVKSSDSVSLAAAALEGFRQITLTAIDDAIAVMDAGNAARAGERDEVSAAIADSRVQNLMANNPRLKQLAQAALDAQPVEEQQAAQAKSDLSATKDAVIKAFEDLAKLLA